MQRVPGSIQIERVRKESLWAVLAFPPEILAKLWPFDLQVQPALWRWNNLWFFLSRKFPYPIQLLVNNSHVEISPEEMVTLPNHHQSILVVRDEKDQAVLLCRPTMLQGSVPSLDFRDWYETPLKRRFLGHNVKESRWLQQLGPVQVRKITGEEGWRRQLSFAVIVGRGLQRFLVTLFHKVVAILRAGISQRHTAERIATRSELLGLTTSGQAYG